MSEMRKELRGLSFLRIRQKEKLGKDYPCPIHFRVMQSVGWLTLFCVLILIIVALTFRILVKYTSDMNNTIDEKNMAAEIDTLLTTKNYLDATASSNLKDIAISIRDDIEANFDMDQLEQDLTDGILPDKLADIFEDNLKGQTSIPGINYETNNIIICTANGIIADYSHVYAYEAEETRTWDIERSRKLNQELYDTTINAILTQDTRVFYMYQEVTSGNTDGIFMPSYVDRDVFEQMYREEGLEGLKRYTFLVPVYINNDGDIFGKADIINGKRVKNNKFILIQRYSLYDYVITHNLDKLSSNDLGMGSERLEFMLMMSAFIIILFIIALIIMLSVGMNILSHNTETQLCMKEAAANKDIQ